MKGTKAHLYFLILLLPCNINVFALQQSWNIDNKTLELSNNEELVLHSNDDTKQIIHLKSPIKNFIRTGKTSFALQTSDSFQMVEIEKGRIITKEAIQLPFESQSYRQVFHFVFHEQSLQIKINHDKTYTLNYKKSALDSMYFSSKLYTSDFFETNDFSSAFDYKNQILYLQLPNSNQYIEINFATKYYNIAFLENHNDVLNPQQGLWFYDEYDEITYLFIKEGRRKGLYHAFKFKKGIPKPDIRNGQSLFHSKDWYEHELFVGKYTDKPDYIRNGKIWKNNVASEIGKQD